MTLLGEQLCDMIANEGPISVERYMQLCLQHPRYGYYTTRPAFGRAGDFITAPEVDQMFGELVGLWAAQVWLTMGAPSVIRLIELGPGLGTLMADAVRATRIVPGFHEAMQIDLVETSPRLRALQGSALGDADVHPSWYAAVDEVPDGAAIVIANEFFDALPVRQYVRGMDGWHERLVGLDGDGGLAFGASREPLPLRTVTRQAADARGDICEIGHVAIATMAALAARIGQQGGAILVCDYGHAVSGFGETLQAVRGHRYADVLDSPGAADLTAHVDFAALGRAAADAGAAPHGPIAQGMFLRRLGIVERASVLRRGADARQAAAIDAALARFVAPESSMATLFKVMAVTQRDAPIPPGFADDP